ncbi:MAG: type II toxin-antitoxin system VapC family toxin [Anaerosomatales bacterium]|nr:type II toxin-antitoxin system VapC family toxin [Anaerosomatales bacterium]MDT8433987.1 type II toxin-antitoxin system VapC family toxin [Anaerosomatales bacterium]
MNPMVVDSSVAFKWLSPRGESGLERAVELLLSHRAGELTLMAPAFLHVELASSLRHSRYLDRDETIALVGALGELDIELIESTPTRLVAATDLSYRHGMSVYDALFLALAKELSCPLITADRKAFAGIDTPVEIRLL